MSHRHERTVVLGDNACTAGCESWPCPQSAEGRWAALREWAEKERRLASVGSSGDAFIFATVLGDVLEQMTELEAGQ